MSSPHDEHEGDSISERNGSQTAREGRVNETIAFRSLSQITTVTKSILGPEFDYESVAAEIWVTSWENCGCPKGQAEVQVSYNFIKQRCLDHIRRKDIEERANKIRVSFVKNEVDVEAIVLEDITSRCSLKNDEWEFLSRFYLHKQTLTEVAAAMRLPITAVRILKDQVLNELKRVSRQENL